VFAQEDPPPPTAIQNQIAASLKDDRIDYNGVITDSLRLLILQHGIRVATQERTRVQLTGPFLQDYIKSVRVPRTWGDLDGWFVNYMGHPMQGAASGFIFMRHDPKSRGEHLGSANYWRSRWRAVAFAAIYSLQFEIGPLSEASIGNVGMNPATTGWVDYVMTPLGGMAFLVAEDAADRYFLTWFEKRVHNKVLRGSLRILCGPSQMLANLSAGRLPWDRDGRPITKRY
jgi:hypothetical protein